MLKRTQRITRELQFDAGHRLLGHEGACRFLHGHRYCAMITITSEELDSIGRVIDFKVIKEVIGGWIDENWDHNILINSKDPLLSCPVEVFNGRKPYIMPCNPTAENMARILYNKSYDLLERKFGTSFDIKSVELYETPNCSAFYSEKGNGEEQSAR